MTYKEALENFSIAVLDLAKAAKEEGISDEKVKNDMTVETVKLALKKLEGEVKQCN